MVAQSAQAKIESAGDAKAAATDDQKEAEAAAAVAATESHPHRGQYVQYLGPRNAAAAAANGEFDKRRPKLGEGTVAEITVATWKQHGIEAKRPHMWNLANNWRIPATQFTEEQLEYLLTASKRFELQDAKGNKVERD